MLSPSLLLQCGGGERWYRSLFPRALSSLGHDGGTVGDAHNRSLCNFWINLYVLPLRSHKARWDQELWVDGGPNAEFNRAVVTRDECPNGTFTFNDESKGNRLHAPR